MLLIGAPVHPNTLPGLPPGSSNSRRTGCETHTAVQGTRRVFRDEHSGCRAERQPGPVLEQGSL